MELIILSIVGSLGAVLLHLLEFIVYPSDHSRSAVISPQTRSAGAAELRTKPRGAAFRQRLQDQKRVTASARNAEDLASVISEELRDQNHGRKEGVARPGRTVMDSAHLMHYDNATRSCDHEHDEIKVPYHFADLDAMQADFWTYVHARGIRR